MQEKNTPQEKGCTWGSYAKPLSLCGFNGSVAIRWVLRTSPFSRKQPQLAANKTKTKKQGGKLTISLWLKGLLTEIVRNPPKKEKKQGVKLKSPFSHKDIVKKKAFFLGVINVRRLGEALAVRLLEIQSCTNFFSVLFGLNSPAFNQPVEGRPAYVEFFSGCGSVALVTFKDFKNPALNSSRKIPITIETKILLSHWAFAGRF